MMLWGDGHVWGFMTWGGRASIDWCCLTTDGFENEATVAPLPAAACTSTED